DHSKVDPLLPIPTRTVKRLRADDSGLPVCESRSSSGSYPSKPQHTTCWGFVFETRKITMHTRRYSCRAPMPPMQRSVATQPHLRITNSHSPRSCSYVR